MPREDAWVRQTARSSATRRTAVAEHLVLALVAFVPQLVSRPGALPADTKTYLYVDPARFLGQSLSMWDPSVGLGTVTHQQIGYLFPMGPFFLATHALGVPAWVAQRLWVGAILFAAGAGVRFLCRTLHVGGPGRVVASLAYLLSPYPLQYIGHISVILLAFAALPWLVALVEHSAAGGGWRAPAAVALVVAAMASVNASSALYVAVGPAVWLAYAALTRQHSWRAVVRTLRRCGLLAGLVSLWWLAALGVEGGYGIDVLRYTETIQAVSSSSLSSEVLRGLGYWYFYGGDNFGPWVSAMPQFTEQLWLIAACYVVPLLAVTSAVVLRWRYRAAFVTMAMAGMALAVGASPLSNPSPAGHLLESLFTGSKLGMALRSTDRATPLVVLGLAVLLGAGVTALWRRSRRQAVVLAGVAVGAAVLSNPALWNGTSVPTTFVEPAVTSYEVQAAHALDRSGATPVLAVPGQPFAATFTGTTVDPLWPGLLTRPFVTREQQVQGSLPTEDLLYAIDDPIQNGVEDPGTLAAMARLAGAGDLLVQNDLAFTRYDQPDPAVLWSALATSKVPNLGRLVGFGPRRNPLGRTTVVDEQAYTLSSHLPSMPAVAVVPVTAPRPLVRAEAATGGLVVDGDAVGVNEIAGTGLLAGSPVITYAGTLDTDPAARHTALKPGATLVLTDSNRRQAFRWDTLTDVAGATLSAGQAYPGDPQDHPLDLFPGAPADAQSITALAGVASVSSSESGNLFQYLPEDRPAEAVDGNLTTAWQVGPFLDPRGQWWQVTFSGPRRADTVTLVQPQTGRHNQWITGATLWFDGSHPLHVVLGPSSRQPGGQVVSLPARTFRRLRVTIDDTNVSPAQAQEGGVSAVGLAEVRVADVRATESVVMPRDLLSAAGAASAADRLAVVMTRWRVASATSRADPEPAIDRTLWLPASRTFTLTGTVRIDTRASDGLVDQLLGRPGSATSTKATSTGRLDGEVADTAAAALDGNPSTAWTSPLGSAGQVRQSLTVRSPSAITFDHLDLQVVVDGRHSVPSRLRVSTESGSAVVSVPKLPRQPTGGVDRTTLRFPALTGRVVTVSIVGIRPLRAVDYYGGGRQHLPVAIAELGIPGAQVPALPALLPDTCRDDLLLVDGQPVWTSVGGSTAAALAGTGLPLSLCGPDAGGISLGSGTHQVAAAPGTVTGLDVDQVVMDSAAGGGPELADRPAAILPAPTPPSPAVQLVHRGTTTLQLRISPTTAAGSGSFWLVLGESRNDGWQAQVQGGPSLGSPTLVDGFANGWLVPAGVLHPGSAVTVTLRWAPQRAVNASLLVSATAGLACLVLLVWPRRREGSADPAHHGLVELMPLDAGSPSESGTPGSDVRRTAVAAVAGGAVTAFLFDPLVGAGVAAVVAGACFIPRGRAALAGGAVALVLATAVTVVVIEGAGGYLGNGDWPAHFTVASGLTWSALGLLVGEMAVRWVGRGRGGRRARPAAPPGSPPPSPPS